MTMDALEWSERVADLAVDALIDHKLIRAEDFDRAVAWLLKKLTCGCVLMITRPHNLEQNRNVI